MTLTCITARFLLAMSSGCRGLVVSSQIVVIRKIDPSSVNDVRCFGFVFSYSLEADFFCYRGWEGVPKNYLPKKKSKSKTDKLTK